jgi:hypothetical protein
MPRWILGLLLAAPLVGLSGWLVHGWVTRSQGPAVATGLLAGFPVPEADLPADKLEDRVDGAAEALRTQGCRRLLYWRLVDPPADLEVLVFRTAKGAGTTMEREAGPERMAGPGDEAQASDQAVYFRRGPFFVRLLLDPAASVSAETLTRKAHEVDRALRQGAGR